MSVDGNFIYHFRIHHGSNWRNGKYEGQIYEYDMPESAICFETISTLLEYYGLRQNGAITYVAPCKDPLREIQCICGEMDVNRLLETHKDGRRIDLYVVPPFTDQLCSEDPWMEELRINHMVRTIANKRYQADKRRVELAAQRSSQNQTYGTPAAPRVQEPEPVGLSEKAKGKRPMVYTEEEIMVEDTDSDSLGISDPNWRATRGDVESDTDDELTTVRRNRSGIRIEEPTAFVPERLTRRKSIPEGEIPDLIGAMDANEGQLGGGLVKQIEIENINLEVNVPSDTLHTPPGSDDEEEEIVSKFRASIVDEEVAEEFGRGTKKYVLKLGMKFVDGNSFREYMVGHSIQEGYEMESKGTNGPKRIEFRCKQSNCGFKVGAVQFQKQVTFQLRKLVEEHTCGRAFHTKKIGGKWICKNFIELIRNEPRIRSGTIADEIQKRFNFDVKRWNICEGIRLAREKLKGDRLWQYERLRDYADTLMMHNPGSRVGIQVDPMANPLRPRFERMFVCLKGCVDGFLAGCRPFIGLDGCHLKGIDGGQLLSAVSRDADNRVFPICYAWVEAETYDSWKWFVQLLKEELGCDRSWVIMSDRQKGLIHAVEEILPSSDHRFCARHIHQNMLLAKHNDADIKSRFWAAACAYNYHRHKTHMDYMKDHFPDAWAYLNKIDTKTWCRYEFHPETKTDLVVNNVAESWNAQIKEARDKPPITLMEMLRPSFTKRREEAARHEWNIFSNVLEKIKKKKDHSRGMMVMYAGNGEYEVLVGTMYQFTVDINRRICSCLEWNLTGIPCAHATACLLKSRLEVADYVHPIYDKATMQKIYQPVIHPIPGVDDWIRGDSLPIDPPEVRRQGGRPKKKRTPAPTETINKSGDKLTKVGLAQYCSHCGDSGHNKRGCPKKDQPGQTSYQRQTTANAQTTQKSGSSKGGTTTRQTTKRAQTQPSQPSQLRRKRKASEPINMSASEPTVTTPTEPVSPDDDSQRRKRPVRRNLNEVTQETAQVEVSGTAKQASQRPKLQTRRKKVPIEVPTVTIEDSDSDDNNAPATAPELSTCRALVELPEPLKVISPRNKKKTINRNAGWSRTSPRFRGSKFTKYPTQ